MAWNSLPDYLGDVSRSFDSFRPDLKTFLGSRATGVHSIGGFAIMRYINLQLTFDVGV